MGSPEQIGGIRPYAEINQGATTTVYKGFQKSLDRFVLLKVLRPEFSRDEELAQQFEEEARLAAKVQHPNVVSIYSFGRENKQAYIAAEFVEGITVKELIQKGRVPADIAAYIVEEAAKGLKAAHQKSVLHRDIKPANIMISTEGRVKVTDFGMASFGAEKGPQKDKVRGTLAYLSPELILGESPSETSDLFSLGATLFEMLSGEAAFQGEDSRELLDSVQNFDPMQMIMDDEVPSQVRRIGQQLLKKKPAQRYQNCTVLLSDLDAYRKTRGPSAIASAVDMKSYMEDPDAYKKRLRDKPVQLRERAKTGKTVRAENRPAAVKKKEKKSSSQIDLRKLFTTVGLLVVLFAGLSFAGSFFFSKDGQFGAQSNPAGASRPQAATSGGSSAVAGRGRSSGGGRAVQADGSGPDTPQQPSAPPVEDAPLVTVNDENPEEGPAGNEGTQNESDGPPSAVPDTVTILDEPGRPTGRIMVDATPWAYVYIDGDSVGITPVPLVASPGTYPLTLRNPDFPPFETLVDVIPGRETPVQISLWTLVGTVQIDVFPFARVSIDGVYRDDTPFERPLIVKPGAHTLTLAHPSLGSFESTFEISAGESKSMKFNLNEMN